MGRGGWWVGYYNFPRSTNKIGMENQIFILRTPAAINYFHQILKNCHFGVRKTSFLTHMDLYDPYMVPYTIL